MRATSSNHSDSPARTDFLDASPSYLVNRDPAPSERCPPPTLIEIAAYFDSMIDHCYEYAVAAHEQRKPIVGIVCEFTPRELILAAGGVPVCLCGGSADTIPAAEQFLPANLCPLIKSTFGYQVRRSNPFLEMASLVVGETSCDGKKKMFEQMRASREVYVLSLPYQSRSADALAYWTAELRRFKAFLEEFLGVRITPEKTWEAIGLMNRERALRRQLADLMMLDRPPMTSRQLIEFKSIISGLDQDFQQYETALSLFRAGEALPGSLRAEPKSHKVRVLLTGVPMVHGAERVLDLIESCGSVVVCMENCTGVKPILEDVATDGDPIEALATKYFHLPCSVMTPNERRFESLRKLAARFRPHCVIELVWQACLTYDVESFFVRKLVEEELKLPYLKITTDYSPSDSARLVGRIEALMELVRSRQNP